MEPALPGSEYALVLEIVLQDHKCIVCDSAVRVCLTGRDVGLQLLSCLMCGDNMKLIFVVILSLHLTYFEMFLCIHV